MGILLYDSNNSGGRWWLSDNDWKALEDVGWIVQWVHDVNDPSHTHSNEYRNTFRHSHYDKDMLIRVSPSDENRWLGALATRAIKETDNPEAAIAEWESITGLSSTAEGCKCCGEPHNFRFTDDNGNVHYSSVRTAVTRREWF